MSERLEVLATEILPDDIVVGLEFPVRALWAHTVHADTKTRMVYVHSMDETTAILGPTRIVEVVRGT